MAEGGFERMDNVEERRSQDDEIFTRKMFNMMHISRDSKKGFYKLAMVCLGLLCVILLIVIISHKSHNSNDNMSDGRLQPQISDNLTDETSYSNLKKQMDLLLTSHNTLIQENSQLLTRYNNLTDNRNIMQMGYNNLILQKLELDDKYNNLAKEKEHLETNYNNLTRQRTKLYSRLTDGWIPRKLSLYKISSEKKSWAESRKSCLNMGADLVIVNDKDEQVFLLSYKNYWIGLSDTQEEGVWRWVDGTALTGGYWAPGEPNNSGDEDCAEISSKASKPTEAWNDVPCSNRFAFICEDRI